MNQPTAIEVIAGSVGLTPLAFSVYVGLGFLVGVIAMVIAVMRWVPESEGEKPQAAGHPHRRIS